MKQGNGGRVLDLGGIEWKSVINFISCQIKVHYDTLLRTRRHLMSLFRDDTVVLVSTLKHCCQKLGSQSHLWQVCLQVAGQDLAPQVGAWQAAPQGGRAEQGERQESCCSDQRQLFAFEQLFRLHFFRGGQHLNGEHLSWELLTCWGGCAVLFFHVDPGFQGQGGKLIWKQNRCIGNINFNIWAIISYLPGDQTGSNEIEEKKPTRSSMEHVFAWSEINSFLVSVWAHFLNQGTFGVIKLFPLNVTNQGTENIRNISNDSTCL